MHILSYIVIAVWVLSAIGLVVCILMHSGKGDGLADIASSNLSSTTSTSLVEKNLNRITVCLFIVFILGALLLMKFNLFPMASIV